MRLMMAPTSVREALKYSCMYIDIIGKDIITDVVVSRASAVRTSLEDG